MGAQFFSHLTQSTDKVMEKEFDKWLEQVDDICFEKYGMSIHDLPDMEFMDSFECGVTPEQFIDEEIPDEEALGELIFS